MKKTDYNVQCIDEQNSHTDQPIVKREHLEDESLYVGGEYTLARGP
jgi:hypothetical protein